jgi:FtsH-binding integral membrane protein
MQSEFDPTKVRDAGGPVWGAGADADSLPGAAGGPMSSHEHLKRSELAATFMTHVFGWMAAGLALSGAVAAWVMSSEAVFAGVVGWYLPLIIAELVMVVALSAGLKKMSPTMAAGMFLAYAALNGLTLGVIVAMYTGTSVARVFFITSGTYAAMAAIGATTKRDLTQMGSFLMMGVIAILIAMVVNLFLASSALDWAISVLGALIFAGLTAFDVQRFKALGYMGFSTSREAGQYAIRGALNLYLDFINMFLFLLRLFGDRR